MKHKLQTRKIQPSDPKSMQDKLNNIPDFCNQQVVTVNVPSEEYLPRNVFLNNTAYVLDLKILKHNKRRNSIPETTSSGNRAMNRTIKNSSESDIPLHEAIPTPEMPQVFPNTPFFQQQFGYYPSWRPRFHPFQRPMFPAHRFNQQPYFYRMPNFMPHRFNARPPPYMFNQNHDQRKRQRRNVRHDHLHAIRNLAQRLKQFTTPNYVLRSALISLLKRFNEIYNERMQITPDFDIIGDKQIETIEIEDDETPTKKAKIDTKKFNKVLDNVKTLAARLKNLERKTQSTSKQKRAFCNLLKNFNKAFDADFSLNTKGDLIDNKLVVIDSSSDSDVVATEDIDTNKTKKRSSNSAEHYDKKNKKRKILCNPFSILKKVNEGASTSQAFENIAVERKSTDLLKYFNKYWLRDDDDFGKAAVCSKTDARYLLNDSQQMYEFMDDPRAFDNWSDLKLAFCVHMDAVFAFEHDLTAHSRNLTMDKSRLKPLLQTETADDWESSLDMLRIIKTNTDVQETSLTVHFDVYNRDED
ncbi:putative tRNA splicing endonuclease 54-like protein [Operophtera brumata]|uniref:Putative tRNA splicing endonuclease 54-like protein n=1 Tax=Operophtera brumata TaxID=104452 RepID=A0A0L7LPA5_OPEBR|nr:putative tRNA splicing endonuclease 54-like protein [Operophtera brumata]